MEKALTQETILTHHIISSIQNFSTRKSIKLLITRNSMNAFLVNGKFTKQELDPLSKNTKAWNSLWNKMVSTVSQIKVQSLRKVKLPLMPDTKRSPLKITTRSGVSHLLETNWGSMINSWVFSIHLNGYSLFWSKNTG